MGSLMVTRLGAILTLAALASLFPASSFAETGGDILLIQETVIPMSIPSDNRLPWGFVEGNIQSHAADYPVVIQIYQGNSPVHFAQVQVSEDGHYEYRFRVLDVTDKQTTKIFEGDYTVKIFKVVHLDSDYLDYLVGQKNSGMFDIGIDVLRNYDL